MGSPSRLMPELLHHLKKELLIIFETLSWRARRKRYPPDPPTSMLIGKTVSWVVQSIRALAGTPVKANIEIGGAGDCLPRNPTGSPAHKPLFSSGAIIRASTVLQSFLRPLAIRFSLSRNQMWAGSTGCLAPVSFLPTSSKIPFLPLPLVCILFIHCLHQACFLRARTSDGAGHGAQNHSHTHTPKSHYGRGPWGNLQEPQDEFALGIARNAKVGAPSNGSDGTIEAFGQNPLLNFLSRTVVHRRGQKVKATGTKS